MTFLLVPMDEAVPSVINMPKPLPDIVKSYKSITINARNVGMLNTGVQVQEGDYITILAKGAINLWPSWTPGAQTSDGYTPTTDTGNFLRGPKRILVFQLKEKVPVRSYTGPELIEVQEKGDIYLGYKDGGLDSFGKPLKPEYYRDNTGALYVDIIVWKSKDPNRIAKFFEESSLARPEDKTLKEVAQEFKIWQEKAIEAERVEKGLQALKELEDLKKKRSEPVIMVAYPKDGITIDSEYINLYGVAEHEKGISKFEILLNGQPVMKDSEGCSAHSEGGSEN